MRVLYISYDGVLEPLGQSQIVAYLKKLALNNGLEFTLITFEKKQYLRDKDACRRLYLDLKKHNINWVKLPYHKRPPVFSTFFDILVGAFFATGIIMKKKHDAVHARAYVPALICLFLKKVFGVKFVFDMRGFWADERIDAGLWREKGLLYNLVKSLEKKFIFNSDSIILLTKRSARYIDNCTKPGAVISIAPCAVDLTRFKFDRDASIALRKKHDLNGKFIFLHAGSLEGWYLLDKMLDFFKSAMANIPNAHFFILTHSKADSLLKLAETSGLGRDNITLASASYNDMPYYISMADAGLFFLKPTFSMEAASPTKVGEYLGCGLPIISNRGIGDIEDYVLDGVTGSLLSNFSQESYREASKRIFEVAGNADTRQQCRKVAEGKLSLDVVLPEYIKLYELLV